LVLGTLTDHSGDRGRPAALSTGGTTMRTLTRLTAVVLVLAAAVAVVPPAAATTPPAPTPGPSLQAPPLAESGEGIRQVRARVNENAIELTWDATLPTTVLQLSAQAPWKVDGRWSLGAAQPVAAVGSLLSTPGQISLDGQSWYRFTRIITGLPSGATRHVLLSLPTAPGEVPVQVTGPVTTWFVAKEPAVATDTRIAASWVASYPSLRVSFGRQGQTAATDQVLTGVKVSAGSAPRWRFTRTWTGLTPKTAYWAEARPSYAAMLPTGAARMIVTTRTKLVTATVTRIVVDNDADAGLRGRGEMFFHLRVNKTLDLDEQGYWSQRSPWFKAGNGDVLTDFHRGLVFGREITGSKALVMVQGVEDDTLPTTRKACHLELFGGNQRATVQDRSLCFNAAYASAQVSVPTHAFTGTHVQTATAIIERGSTLRFTVTLRVETRYV
jgi:hypothetical protein